MTDKDNQNDQVKTVSRWRELSPNFVELCFNDPNMIIALKMANAWAKFWVQYISRDLTKAGRFFTKSPAHQALYYNLLLTVTDAVLFRQSDQIGLKRSDAVIALQSTGVSRGTCNTIINEAIESQYCIETWWRQDNRVKMIYLTTEMHESWFRLFAKTMIPAIVDSDLMTFLHLTDMMEEDFFDDIESKIIFAIEQDQQFRKN